MRKAVNDSVMNRRTLMRELGQRARKMASRGKEWQKEACGEKWHKAAANGELLASETVRFRYSLICVRTYLRRGGVINSLRFFFFARSIYSGSP
jgi:hypothetical protein